MEKERNKKEMTHIENKRQTSSCKPSRHISNCLTCEWIKYSKPKDKLKNCHTHIHIPLVRFTWESVIFSAHGTTMWMNVLFWNLSMHEEGKETFLCFWKSLAEFHVAVSVVCGVWCLSIITLMGKLRRNCSEPQGESVAEPRSTWKAGFSRVHHTFWGTY